MNAQKLANDWDIDEQTMMDYLIAINMDDDNIDRVELDAEQVSEILKLYVEDESID